MAITSTLPAYQKKKIIFAINANNADVMRNIITAYPYAVQQVMHGFAQQFRTPYDVWLFTRNNFRYLRDDDQEQQIALPSASVRRIYNDCKSYSLFIASVCRALGHHVQFRFGGNTPGRYSHIWTVINGIPVDGCARNYNWQKKYKFVKTIQL